MKEFMEILPTLIAPIKGEVLVMSLAGKYKRSKWAIELWEHDTEFKGRESVKNKIPIDFLVETPPAEDNKTEISKSGTKTEAVKLERMWKLYTDRASTSDGSGTGLMMINPKGKEYTYAIRFKFETTKNKAEYEALLACLRIAQEMEIKKLVIFKPEQESRCTKKVSFHDLQTSHQGSIGESLRKKINKQQRGPLPTALGNLKFLAIVVEHSTKWVEAKPLTTTNRRQAEKFVWDHVIYRFGVPQIITSKDNNQFTDVTFKLLEEETMAEILEQKMGWHFGKELRVLEHGSLLELDVAKYVLLGK
ncbi:reverse transcriptase domain-containing protein [Tanacetum coccineum]